jgi:hypothetical protein
MKAKKSYVRVFGSGSEDEIDVLVACKKCPSGSAWPAYENGAQQDCHASG